MEANCAKPADAVKPASRQKLAFGMSAGPAVMRLPPKKSTGAAPRPAVAALALFAALDPGGPQTPIDELQIAVDRPFRDAEKRRQDFFHRDELAL